MSSNTTWHSFRVPGSPQFSPVCLTALLGDWRASSSIELSLKHMCLCPNSCIIPCTKSTQSLAKQHGSGQVTGHKGAMLTWRINNKAFEWASNALFSLLICAPFGISTDQLLPCLTGGKRMGKKHAERETLIRCRWPTANTFVRTLFLFPSLSRRLSLPLSGGLALSSFDPSILIPYSWERECGQIVSDPNSHFVSWKKWESTAFSWT